VRATQFYWLLDRMLAKLVRLPVWPLPTDLAMQPVDATDFAQYLADCVAEGPRGDREDFGGPEILSLGDVATQYQDARGVHRPIRRVPLPRAAAGVAEALTCPGGLRGQTTWSAWLGRQPAG
jgi:uncharacterized protein YbjT (DUF2867 family)